MFEEKILKSTDKILYLAHERSDDPERPGYACTSLLPLGPGYTYTFLLPLDIMNELVDVDGVINDAHAMGTIFDNGVALLGCINVTAFDDETHEATLAVVYGSPRLDDVIDIGHITFASWDAATAAPAWWPVLQKKAICTEQNACCAETSA